MLEADRLHREVALLSNTLVDFDDDDVAGRKVVVDQIIELREQWKDVRYLIETGQQRRKQPEEKPKQADQSLSDAEIRLELGRIRTNISKNTTKLEKWPDHKNADEWRAELDRLIGLREAYEAELGDRKYTQAGKNVEG